MEGKLEPESMAKEKIFEYSRLGLEGKLELM